MSGKRKGSQPESDGHGKAPRLKGHPAAEHREVRQRARRAVRVSGFEKEVVHTLPNVKATLSIEEKEKLLAAIKKHGPENYGAIAKAVETRTAEEIKWFIESKESKTKDDVRELAVHAKTPIQHWLTTANALTRHKVDYSCMLAPVMAIAGKFEPRAQRRQLLSPDYGAIYAFLTQLLEGSATDVSKLQPIDALVILDLFQDLADHLKSLDLTDQRQLMLTKYLLLNRKVAVGSVEAYRVVAKALQEDLLNQGGLEITSSEAAALDTSFQGVAPGTSSQGAVPSVQGEEIAHEDSAVPGPSELNSNAAETPEPGPVESRSAPETTEAHTPRAIIPEMASHDNSEQTPHTGRVVHKAALGAENIATTPPGETVHSDGLTAEVPQDVVTRAGTLGEPSPAPLGANTVAVTRPRDPSPSPSSEEVTVTQSELHAEPTPGPSDLQTAAEATVARAPEIHVNKSKFYTLNPFAIDVKYLKPRPKGGDGETTRGSS